MLFKKIPGKKFPGDKILLAKTNGWEAIRHVDLFVMLTHWAQIEDRMGPRGRQMLLDAIIDLFKGMPLQELIKNYQYKLQKNNNKIF